MTELGATQRFSMNTGGLIGFPKAPALTTFQGQISSAAGAVLWVDPTRSPGGALPFLVDGKAAHDIDKFAADTTTTIEATGVNSLPCLSFTGSATQGLTIPTLNFPTSYTVVAVANLNDAGAAAILGSTNNDSPGRVNFTYNTGGVVRLDHGTGNGASTSSAAIAIDDSQWAVIWGGYDETDGFAVGVDSSTSLATSGAVDHSADPGVYVGSLAGQNEGTFRMADLLLFDRALHATDDGLGQLSAVITQLKTRYGIS